LLAKQNNAGRTLDGQRRINDTGADRQNLASTIIFGCTQQGIRGRWFQPKKQNKKRLTQRKGIRMRRANTFQKFQKKCSLINRLKTAEQLCSKYIWT
jgi:hypothetical protein